MRTSLADCDGSVTSERISRASEGANQSSGLLISSTGVRSSNGLFFVIIVTCSASASSSSSMYDSSSSASEPNFRIWSFDAASSNQISAVGGATFPVSSSFWSSSRRYFQVPRSASARTAPESTKPCSAASSIPNSAATSAMVKNFLLSMSVTQCEQVWRWSRCGNKGEQGRSFEIPFGNANRSF